MARRKKTRKKVRTPSQKRSAQTVEAVLDATALVLTERGYAGTTTNHIARKAGVGIASFYAYFPDKDAAIAAVVERFVDQAVAVLVQEGTSVLNYEPVEALRIALHRTVEIAASQGPLIRVLSQQVPFVWELPAVQKLLSRLMQLGRAYAPVQDFVPAREVTEERLYLMIVMIGALVGLLATDKKIHHLRKEIVDEFVEIVGFGFQGWTMARRNRTDT